MIDINECDIGDHNCISDAYCNDTSGSYNCTCPAGYELGDDGYSCDGIIIIIHNY